MQEDVRIPIIWQSEKVGVLLNPTQDMWYLEGKWIGNNTPAGKAFEMLAKALDVKKTFQDLGKGIDVYLEYEGDYLSRGLVLSLSDKNGLYLRQIIHPEEFDKEYRSKSRDSVYGSTSSEARKLAWREILSKIFFWNSHK